MNGNEFNNENKRHENIDNNKEKINDIENDKDIQEGREEDRQIGKEEEQTNEEQEKNSAQEGEDAAEEGDSGAKISQGSDLNQKKGDISSGYTPDFTVVNDTVNDRKNNTKKDKRFGNATILAICGITLALSLLAGMLAGAIAGGGSSLQSGKVTVLKSDRDIVVEEMTGIVGQTKMNVVEVSLHVADSVVEISTSQWYGNGQSGAGSGVVIGKDGNKGYIVTNYHVIEDADNIVIRQRSGKYYKAEYLAGDESEDIAVITITVDDEKELKLAEYIADSDTLNVGEQVVAIGNPLGQLGGTVTDGIISALDREIIVENYPMTLLQTNAAINPGNSGGGLFNMYGELVGIVNAKQSSAGIEGLGFAIPANVVRECVEQLIEHGYILNKPSLGIEVSTSSFGGVFVSDAKNSKVFRYGDYIEKIGDKDITKLSDYNVAVNALDIGDEVEVILTRNGMRYKAKVTVQEKQ